MTADVYPRVCFDCGRRYGDEYGFPDLVIPHDVWMIISPSGDEGGLLCSSCICRRLHEAGITTEGRFTSGPLAPDTAWPLWASPAEASALDRVRALVGRSGTYGHDEHGAFIRDLRAALDPEEPRVEVPTADLVAAAYPIIEAQVRAQIADAIEQVASDRSYDSDETITEAYLDAARIARVTP